MSQTIVEYKSGTHINSVPHFQNKRYIYLMLLLLLLFGLFDRCLVAIETAIVAVTATTTTTK